jgi:hypothetical protein
MYIYEVVASNETSIADKVAGCEFMASDITISLQQALTICGPQASLLMYSDAYKDFVS